MGNVGTYLGIPWIKMVRPLVGNRPAWMVREERVRVVLRGGEWVGDEPSMQAQATRMARFDSEAHGVVVSKETFSSEACR